MKFPAICPDKMSIRSQFIYILESEENHYANSEKYVYHIHTHPRGVRLVIVLCFFITI